MLFRAVSGLITFAFFFMGLSLFNCGDKGSNPPPSSSTVTYNGNGNTAGTAPADAATYTQGASVTVKANSGNLVRTGYTFAGWNTSADGNGTSYAAGTTFSMGSANITLYAKWTKNPIAISDFRITMPGWAAPVDSNIRLIYNDTIQDFTLTYKISYFVDGGDWSYIQDSVTIAGNRVATLDSGLHQWFYRPDPTDSNFAQSFVLDYMTAENALKVYNRMMNHIYGEKTKIGSYDTTVATGVFQGNEQRCYSHFDKYFIECRISIIGINSLLTQDSCAAIANTFVKKYQSIIQ
jgi:uncharacterized repeat protein (TIGR02543 family)